MTIDTNGFFNGGGNGDGMKITAPAGTAIRTLTVYVGGYNSGGTLTASLSDNSAPAYFDSSLAKAGDSFYGYYTLTYQAASANQTLTVIWKQNSKGSGDGNVSLYAATLQ